jgi:hypothetical protein
LDNRLEKQAKTRKQNAPRKAKERARRVARVERRQAAQAS